MSNPDMIFASRGFALAYAAEIARLEEDDRLHRVGHVNGLDRRKRKKLLNKAERRGRDAFFAKFGKTA